MAAPPREANLALFDEPVGGKWTLRLEETGHSTRRTLAEVGPNPVLPKWGNGGAKQALASAGNLLSSNGGLLGIGDLVRNLDVEGKGGRAFMFVYSLRKPDATHGLIPILGARVDVRIHELGRILLLRSDVPELATDPLPKEPMDRDMRDRIDQQAARFCRQAKARADVDERQARLVYRRGRGDAHALPLWEVPVSSRSEGVMDKFGFVYLPVHGDRTPEFVSATVKCSSGAATGNLVTPARIEVAPESAGPGTVSGWCRVGLDPDSQPVKTPLANVYLFAAGNPPAHTLTTADDGSFAAPLPASLLITLEGKFSGLVDGPNPPVVQLVNGGASVELGGANNTQETTALEASAEEIAHLTAYYWIEKANRHCRPFLPSTPTALDKLKKIQAWVNQPNSDDGAHYFPGLAMVFPTSNPTSIPPRPNMAYSTIILHEWGHALRDAFGGISSTDGLDEGWADVVAMFVADTPRVGPGYNGTGGPSDFLRSGNNDAQYGTGGDDHEKGKSWMGFAWTLRIALVREFGAGIGSQTADQLLLGTLAAGVVTQTDAVKEVFMAAERDGLRQSYLPHFEIIRTACKAHGLPVPSEYQAP